MTAEVTNVTGASGDSHVRDSQVIFRSLTTLIPIDAFRLILGRIRTTGYQLLDKAIDTLKAGSEMRKRNQSRSTWTITEIIENKQTPGFATKHRQNGGQTPARTYDKFRCLNCQIPRAVSWWERKSSPVKWGLKLHEQGKDWGHVSDHYLGELWRLHAM